MQKHEAQNQRTVSGPEIETAVEESAFYSYRDENKFPGAAPNAEVNEFTGWAKFIAEEGTVCAQCDGSNGIHATSLASYHEGNPRVRVQARAEYFTNIGAKELRLSDLHLRVHELHAVESGLLRRVIYDVTPSRSDPRSKHARFFQQLRTEVKRQAIGVQSHFIEWWRRTKNVIARATQFMKQKRLVNERRLAGLPERRSEPTDKALNQIGQQTLNDESPIQPLPTEKTNPDKEGRRCGAGIEKRGNSVNREPCAKKLFPVVPIRKISGQKQTADARERKGAEYGSKKDSARTEHRGV